MLYIVEIPHQRPASCWVADGRGDFVRICADAYRRHGDTPPASPAHYDSWVAYLAADLSAIRIYASDADARAALESEDFHCHGGAAAADRLAEKLAEYCA